MEAMGSLQAHAPASAIQSSVTPGKFSTSWAAELRTSPTLGSAAQTFLTSNDFNNPISMVRGPRSSPL